MTEVIELKNKNLSCRIAPALGGAVLGLDMTRKGEIYHVLQPTPEAALTGGDTRAFSLTHCLPFGGPLRGNTLKWDTKVYPLQPALPGLPIVEDGIGWARPWVGKKDGKFSISLKLVHKADETWPFDFVATIVYDLEEDNLVVSYEISYEGRNGTMPIGLGTRLRFPQRRDTVLTANVRTVWAMDAGGVPLTAKEIPFNLALKEGQDLQKLVAAHWFSDWTGKAMIDYATTKMSIAVKGQEGFTHIGAFSNPDGEVFTLFPLTHVPGMTDIKGHDEDETGLRWLGPGESFAAQLKVDVDMSLY